MHWVLRGLANLSFSAKCPRRWHKKPIVGRHFDVTNRRGVMSLRKLNESLMYSKFQLQKRAT